MPISKTIGYLYTSNAISAPPSIQDLNFLVQKWSQSTQWVDQDKKKQKDSLLILITDVLDNTPVQE